jgi:hypothetical protein
VSFSVSSMFSQAVTSSKFLVRVARAIGAESVLGATCGALYGTVFGGLGPLVHDEPWRILGIAGACALAGLGIGAFGSDWHRIREAPSSTGSEPPAQAGAAARARRDQNASEHRAPSGVGVPRLTAG